MTEDRPPRGTTGPMKERRIQARARENVDEWGQQSISVLLLALVEELGELTDEVAPEDRPETDAGAVNATWSLLDCTREIGCHTQDALEDNFEGPDGEPLAREDWPAVAPEREDLDVDAVREELYDAMALMYQLDWALYQGVRERDRTHDEHTDGGDR